MRKTDLATINPESPLKPLNFGFLINSSIQKMVISRSRVILEFSLWYFKPWLIWSPGGKKCERFFLFKIYLGPLEKQGSIISGHICVRLTLKNWKCQKWSGGSRDSRDNPKKGKRCCQDIRGSRDRTSVRCSINPNIFFTLISTCYLSTNFVMLVRSENI